MITVFSYQTTMKTKFTRRTYEANKEKKQETKET